MTYFTFKGNQSRVFLKKIDYLQRALEKEGGLAYLKGLPFVECLRSFSQLVHNCFGVKLNGNFETSLRQFKEKYMALEITIIPKAHIIFEHVGEFIKIINGDQNEEKVGLGYFSEQSFESMHHDVKIQWERVKVPTSHKDFGPKLKSFVTSYNSRHI